MNYYKINTVFNKSVTGVEGFQTSKMYGKYNYDAEDSVWNFTKNDPLITPKLSPFLLEKGAKLTDRISTNQINSIYALIIQKKLFDFIDSYTKADYLAKKVLLTYEGNSFIEGYLLYIIKENKYDAINFTKSSFKIGSAIKKIDLDVTIDSERSLLNTIQVLKEEAWHKKVVAKKIVLKDSFNLDIFRLGVFGGLYASEKLKNGIEEKGFTGMEFKSMEHIVKEE